MTAFNKSNFSQKSFKLFGLFVFGAISSIQVIMAQGISNTLLNGGNNQNLNSIYSNALNGQLPQVNGMHLTEGLNRAPNAQLQPYNPGEPAINMQIVRWINMPIAVWISPGLELPKVPFDEIPNTRCDLVSEMLKANPKDPFSALTKATLWSEQTNEIVAEGIEQWREFEKEGLFKFGFADNPCEANVLVFFTDSFQDANGPGGIAAGGITTAKIFPIDKLHLVHKVPVIIELSLGVNNDPAKLQAASAHEFGHALGIKAHSPYREDIMYVDRVVNSLSGADKATIRWLYKQKPNYVMY